MLPLQLMLLYGGGEVGIGAVEGGATAVGATEEPVGVATEGAARAARRW